MRGGRLPPCKTARRVKEEGVAASTIERRKSEGAGALRFALVARRESKKTKRKMAPDRCALNCALSGGGAEMKHRGGVSQSISEGNSRGAHTRRLGLSRGKQLSKEVADRSPGGSAGQCLQRLSSSRFLSNANFRAALFSYQTGSGFFHLPAHPHFDRAFNHTL